jgi:hypothetical protein
LKIYLARDCLDNRLLDRKGNPVGHIDGVIMTIEGDTQPRITAIEVGSVAQARRIGPRVGRWLERLSQRFGRMRPNPYRIPWSALEPGAHDYSVNLDAADLPQLAWEHWFRERVVARLPGA